MSLMLTSPALADINLEPVSGVSQSMVDVDKVNTVGQMTPVLQVYGKPIGNPIRAYDAKQYSKFRLTGISFPGVVGKTYKVVKWSFINQSPKTIHVIRFFLVEVSPFGEPVYKYRFDAVGEFKSGIEYKKIGSLATFLKEPGTHWEIKDTRVMFDDGQIWESVNPNVMDY